MFTIFNHITFFSCIAGSMIGVSGFSDVPQIQRSAPYSVKKPDRDPSTKSTPGFVTPGNAGARKNVQSQDRNFKTEVTQNSSGNNEYSLKSEKFGKVELTQKSDKEFSLRGSHLNGTILIGKDQYTFLNTDKKSMLQKFSFNVKDQKYTANLKGFREGTVEVSYYDDYDEWPGNILWEGPYGHIIIVDNPYRMASSTVKNIGFDRSTNPVVTFSSQGNDPNRIQIQYADDRGWNWVYEGSGDVILFTQALGNAYDNEKITTQEAFTKYMNEFMANSSRKYLGQLSDQTAAMFAAFDVAREVQAENLRRW